MKKIKRILSENLVVLFFAVLCIAAYVIADQKPYMVASDLINRVMRNSIMVMALIIPIMTGMGLNFGIVVGAMTAQGALIFITHWHLDGMVGFMAALLLCTAFSIVCGWLLGRLFNSTRGQEMITGMIAGYFGQGIYLLIFLVLVGTVIPFWDPDLSISTGIGIKDTLNLSDGMKGALDSLWKLKLDKVLYLALAILAVYTMVRLTRRRGQATDAAMRRSLLCRLAAACVGVALLVTLPVVSDVVKRCKIPMATLGFIILVSMLCQFITKTKLGQDFRSVGNDIKIAEAAGIDVDRVRILATIFSTVLAAWGQLVFLQNMGTFSTYTAQQNVGTFSVAALLVGGASIDKANVKQAFVGVVLFQLLFLLAPAAGTKIFNDSQAGEYFRTVISNGVIAVSLVLHAVNKVRLMKAERAKA